MPPRPAPALEALGRYEVATGFPLGRASPDAVPAVTGEVRPGRAKPRDPLGVLEGVALRCLARPPCVVLFSGGRDSSALLALATFVARREGLPLPVPLTHLFPGQPEAEEHHWQELVVRHLGLSDWARLDAGEDADLLGPAAQGVLRRHGVIWSPLLATRSGAMALAAGGSLLSGEGGDEVFGTYRSTALLNLVSARRPRQAARLVKAALADLSPRPVRAQRWRSHFARALGLGWLRPEVREGFLARLAGQWSTQPFAWGKAVEWVASCRHVGLALANMAGLAAEVGADFQAPFLEPEFVEALPGAFGPLGPAGRTAAMRSLFSGLLPDELLARSTKAVFTLPAWGPRTEEFVAHWDGSGLDEDLVDVEALRRHWAEERPNAMSFGLLQQAWLSAAKRSHFELEGTDHPAGTLI